MMASTVKTSYWHKTEDNRIQCDLCPRACKLRNGQRGLCFVRACENDEIVLTTYGRSSGFCVDPIEKKPPNHFYPRSPVLSFGTAGCNLSCKFCQNWDISKSRQEFFAHMDATNIDLKAFSEKFYYQLCGGKLADVLDTILYVKHETNTWLELTTLLIPGENDSPKEIDALSSWIMENLGPDVPLHLTAFHPDYKMLDKSHTSPLSLT